MDREAAVVWDGGGGGRAVVWDREEAEIGIQKKITILREIKKIKNTLLPAGEAVAGRYSGRDDGSGG